ncbi:SH3 domain-containing protein [Leptolyngbya sp. KIOST-1]|uniref:SH3 domain-containing protein n=1 Tax=Leptolyngbya sp. KIOST-1 TaxID=1229172 RepID=UPI0006913AC5|nr:SH3 domain-containing protein [Leptolyngbya sp. KIOST-1]
MKSSRWLLWVGLVLVLGGCNRGGNSDPSAAVEPPGEENGIEAAAGAETVDAGGFRSTAISPTRTAQLITQSEGARINLRSQPTTQATAQGQGQGGDVVTLLRLAEGEGGFSWYYVKFVQSEAEGWVRGDFVDISGQTASAAPVAEMASAPGTAPDIGTGPCGSNYRPEAFFETKSFTIHLCQTPQGLSYIGINKTNNETLSTADVRQVQGTYIAINGNYQYHINNDTLAVYQITSGSYNQLENQEVVRHERFMY